MKNLMLAAFAALLLAGCSSGDLKKEVAEKSQLITAQEAEIRKLKDDMAAREADLKSQCEQRVQKLEAKHKHDVDALNAKIASLSKKKEPEAKAGSKTPSKSKSHR